MRSAHLVAEIRAAEAALAATLPAGTLMQRAAAGLAVTCASVLPRVYGSRVVLLVGTGDNGGDALFAGARLAARGAAVQALLLDPDRVHAGGLQALLRAGGVVAAAESTPFDNADLILDGLVGIGARGGLRGSAARLAAAAAASPAPIVAVDLPSGVDADTGEVSGLAVHADVTVTFGTWKPALLVDPGAGLAGASTLVDIGLAPWLPGPALHALQDDDVASALPRAQRSDDKYRRGVLGICAGSAAYPGAAVLTVGAALDVGVGMVRFVGPAPAAAAVRARWPEVVVSEQMPQAAGRVQAWVVGPGMGTDHRARARLDDVLAADVPVLLDADALTLIAVAGGLPRRTPTLLTPHAGELGRLLDVPREQIEAARLRQARAAAEQFGATVLLKGSTTLICPPGGGPAWVNPTGSPALARAGSGDVLAGMTGALLASGLDVLDAGAVGAYLHGLAARQHEMAASSAGASRVGGL
ncbi:MAG: NAD(P)H-hydrate dehydratase [Sporichthyaceae bacterium]